MQGLGLGFEFLGLRFRVQGSGFRVQGLGFRAQGLGLRVWGSGLRVVVHWVHLLVVRFWGQWVRRTGYRVRPGSPGCHEESEARMVKVNLLT